MRNKHYYFSLENYLFIVETGKIMKNISFLSKKSHPGGQHWNQCKWYHLAVKFTFNASGAMWLPNLAQVTESISGSIVPLAMFVLGTFRGVPVKEKKHPV